jgi:hypothetical protein
VGCPYAKYDDSDPVMMNALGFAQVLKFLKMHLQVCP